MNSSRFFRRLLPFCVLAILSLTSLVNCNNTRNIDEDDRKRRMGGFTEEEWNDMTAGRKPVQSFRFKRVSVLRDGDIDSWIQLDVSAWYWTDDWSHTVLPDDIRLYIDLQKKEAFVKPENQPLQKVGNLLCSPEELACTKFHISTSMQALFAGLTLPARVAETAVIITYEKVKLNLELLELATNPHRVVSHFQGAQMSTNLFPDQFDRRLYSETALPAGIEYEAHYESKDKQQFEFRFQALPPKEGLLFDRCSQGGDGGKILIECYFINPADRTIETTKHVLTYAP